MKRQKLLSKEDIIRILRENKSTLSKYRVKQIGIFGSFAKGQEDKKSDVDVLVEFYGIPDIFLLIDLEDYLKKIIGKKVDLVRKQVIRDELKETIERETVYI